MVVSCLWMVGIEPGLPEEQPGLLTTEAPLLPCILYRQIQRGRSTVTPVRTKRLHVLLSYKENLNSVHWITVHSHLWESLPSKHPFGKTILFTQSRSGLISPFVYCENSLKQYFFVPNIVSLLFQNS